MTTMTPIEEIFYKMLIHIEETSDCCSIYELYDLHGENLIVSRGEYDYVIRWKESIDTEITLSNKKLVEGAKSKLTPEEIEAIKKVGL